MPVEQIVYLSATAGRFVVRCGTLRLSFTREHLQRLVEGADIELARRSEFNDNWMMPVTEAAVLPASAKASADDAI